MGTFRAMNEEWRFKAHELIKKQTNELVAAMGAEAEIKIDVGYPFVLNDEALNPTAKEKAAEYMGCRKCGRNRTKNGCRGFCLLLSSNTGLFFQAGCRQ